MVERQTSSPRRDSWISAACEPAVVRRSLRVAAAVGTLLVAINDSDPRARGSARSRRLGEDAPHLLCALRRGNLRGGPGDATGQVTGSPIVERPGSPSRNGCVSRAHHRAGKE